MILIQVLDDNIQNFLLPIVTLENNHWRKTLYNKKWDYWSICTYKRMSHSARVNVLQILRVENISNNSSMISWQEPEFIYSIH